MICAVTFTFCICLLLLSVCVSNSCASWSGLLFFLTLTDTVLNSLSPSSQFNAPLGDGSYGQYECPAIYHLPVPIHWYQHLHPPLPLPPPPPEPFSFIHCESTKSPLRVSKPCANPRILRLLPAATATNHQPRNPKVPRTTRYSPR